MGRNLNTSAFLALLVGAGIVLVGSSASSDLAKYEKKVFSQQGEDGVIERLFEVIEPTTKFAVEFGAADGIKNSNVRNLVVSRGWSSFQIEGDPKLAEALAANYADYPKTRTRAAWIYPGNVEILFEEAGVPRDLDLLVIDIDSNDYYVWRAIHDFRPKVVLIEVNPHFPPPQKMVINFHPMNYWDRRDYYGASLQSLYLLGKKKGYELVHHTTSSINAFFVDQKYFDRFNIKDNSPAALFHPPTDIIKLFSNSPQGRGNVPFEENNDVLHWDAFEIRKKFIFDR